MGTYDIAMSFGGSMSKTVLFGSMGVTLLASKFWHNTVIGSGSQPVTMCAEYKAAEIKRMMAKPCQSNESKAMLQNPVFNSAFDFEPGRAPQFMHAPGNAVAVVRENPYADA